MDEQPTIEHLSLWWDQTNAKWINASPPAQVHRLTFVQMFAALQFHHLLDPSQLSAEQIKAMRQATGDDDQAALSRREPSCKAAVPAHPTHKRDRQSKRDT